MYRTIRILIRLLPAMCLLPMACAAPQRWTPPERADALPPPEIYHRTPDGLVPITPAEAAEIARQQKLKAIQKAGDESRRDDGAHSNSQRQFPAADDAALMTPSWAEALSRPRITVKSAGPTRDQPYYVRGEHTAAGYVLGHYRREGDYIRGEHTPAGYIRGSYLGSGDYVRGEHTPAGYVPGHYRSVPQPSATAAGRSSSGPSARSTPP